MSEVPQETRIAKQKRDSLSWATARTDISSKAFDCRNYLLICRDNHIRPAGTTTGAAPLTANSITTTAAIFRLLFVLTTFTLLPCTGALGQCMSRGAMWEALHQKPTDISDPEQIRSLTNLKTICAQCGYRNDSLEARLHQVISETYLRLLLIDSARQYCQSAIKITKTAGPGANPAANLDHYFTLGKIEKQSGQMPSAESAFNKCIVLGRKHPGKEHLVARAYRELATISLAAGRYTNSLQEARLGEMQAQTAGHNEPLIELLLLQARTHFLLHDHPVAEKLLMKAKALAQNAGNKETWVHYHQQSGILLQEQQRYAEAMESFQKALPYLDPYSEDRIRYSTVCEAMGNLAWSYEQKPEKALTFFTQAFDFTRNPHRKAHLAENIGAVYGRYIGERKALTFYQKSIAALLPGFSSHEPADSPSLSLLRRLGSKKNVYALIVKKGIAWQDSLRHTALSSSRHHQVATLAMQNLLLADSLLTLMLAERNIHEPAHYWEGLSAPLFQNALALCFQQGLGAQALHFIERSKFIALHDQYSSTGLNGNLSSEETAQYRTLSKETERYLQLMLLEETTETDYVRFNNTLVKLVDSRQLLLKGQAAQNTYLSHLQRNRPRLTPAQLRQEILTPMGESSAYLTFLACNDVLYGLFLTHNSIRLRKIRVADLAQLLPDFQRLLLKPAHSPEEKKHFLALSNQLYHLLVRPFSILHETRIIVSPGHNLVPLEILSSSDVEPDFLVRKHAFSYVYSSSQLSTTLTASRTFPFHRNFVGFLPDARRQNAADRASRGGDTLQGATGHRFFLSKQYSGRSAKAEVFMDKAPLHRVVHLSAQLTGRAPDSELNFSDSLLRMRDLSSRSFKTQLLLLDAAGAGENATDAVFSVAGAFNSLGVASVATWLWKTTDRHHEKVLSDLFLQNLAKRMPADIALQQAKIQWLKKSGISQNNPALWGGFVLIGGSDSVATDHEIYRGLLFGLIIFLITLYTTFVFQKKKKANPPETQEP